uniref:Uncharacterized protein n=1 Tax=Arundo donax TaxID=35708 RepID=A0A0A9FS76_ARUDO
MRHLSSKLPLCHQPSVHNMISGFKASCKLQCSIRHSNHCTGSTPSS